MTTPSADQFLMSGGGKSAKFPAIGTTVTGVIANPPEVQQQRDPADSKPKFWDDGKPMLQLRVTLATAERDPADPEDDGERNLYVKGQMQRAIRDAVKAAGAARLDVGGTLTVTYVADGEKKNAAFNAPKVYAAAYVPPNPLDQIAPPATPAVQAAPPTPAAPAGLDPAVAAALAAAQAPAEPPEPACPPGVPVEQWAQLQPAQKQAVLAAMGIS